MQSIKGFFRVFTDISFPWRDMRRQRERSTWGLETYKDMHSVRDTDILLTLDTRCDIRSSLYIYKYMSRREKEKYKKVQDGPPQQFIWRFLTGILNKMYTYNSIQRVWPISRWCHHDKYLTVIISSNKNRIQYYKISTVMRLECDQMAPAEGQQRAERGIVPLARLETLCLSRSRLAPFVFAFWSVWFSGVFEGMIMRWYSTSILDIDCLYCVESCSITDKTYIWMKISIDHRKDVIYTYIEQFSYNSRGVDKEKASFTLIFTCDK